MFPIGPVNLTHTHTHTHTLCCTAISMPFGVYFVTNTHRFVPFAIETYGRLGRAAVEVLGEWADAAAGSGVFDGDAYLTWVKRELTVTLVRGNARLFKKFVGVLTRGIGQRFVEGMDVPVLE